MLAVDKEFPESQWLWHLWSLNKPFVFFEIRIGYEPRNSTSFWVWRPYSDLRAELAKKTEDFHSCTSFLKVAFMIFDSKGSARKRAVLRCILLFLSFLEHSWPLANTVGRAIKASCGSFHRIVCCPAIQLSCADRSGAATRTRRLGAPNIRSPNNLHNSCA